MGIINKDPYYNHRIRYEESGLYCIFIIINLIKNGSLTDIAINESQIGLLCKSLYTIINRIGYSIDDNIYHLIEENSWPF